MNYYQARQVDPDADRPDAGKWRYTRMNDGAIWPEGACRECDGHDTAEEACQHYVEGEIAQGIQWNDCSWTTCANRPSCDKPARRSAMIGGPNGGFYTLCDDHAADNIVEALFRLDHTGTFSMTSSY